MSSEPGSSKDSSYSSQFSSPCCTLCARKEPSNAYCKTCRHYLCDGCTLAHKIMVCFQSHHVVSFGDIENIEDLERILNNVETLLGFSSSIDQTVDVRELLKTKYSECWKRVDGMTKVSRGLGTTLENLRSLRCETLGYINDVYTPFQLLLKMQRDDIVALLDNEYDAIKKIIDKLKEQLDVKISETVLQLANISIIIDDLGETASGYDFNRLFINDSNNNSTQSGILSLQSSSFLPADTLLRTFKNDNFCPGNTNLDQEQLNQLAASPSSVNSNLVPYEPTNSISTPRKLKCHVNPDLSLSTSDPDRPPLSTAHVHTMQIHNTFGQKGNGSGQFNSPHGFCVGFDEDIVVADSSNHRIQIFDKNGRYKSEFGIAGRHDGCLWHPRRVALLPSQRRYVVCDRGYERSRMQIFTESGAFLKKVYIHYIDIVAGLAINENEDIVVVDSVTPTVFIIGQNDFLRSLDCTDFIEEPSDIAVVGKEFFICDFKAHSIVVIDDDGNLLRKFGSNHTTMFPNGIDISVSGDVVVGDSHGNFFHVVVYSKEGAFIAEYRCPYIKVSRCCGLKITSGGRLITVDKNYHHVIVLETLFVPPESY